jgi:hypothetical protein
MAGQKEEKPVGDLPMPDEEITTSPEMDFMPGEEMATPSEMEAMPDEEGMGMPMEMDVMPGEEIAAPSEMDSMPGEEGMVMLEEMIGVPPEIPVEEAEAQTPFLESMEAALQQVPEIDESGTYEAYIEKVDPIIFDNLIFD